MGLEVAEAEEMRIEKHIPIPRRAQHKFMVGKWTMVIRAMDLGDSIVLDKNKATALYHAAAGIGVHVVRRGEGNGQVRCWHAGPKK